MSNRQETGSDILKEMRGNEWDSPAFNRCALEAAREIAREWADRLEAAWERERKVLMSQPRTWEECVERALKDKEGWDDCY